MSDNYLYYDYATSSVCKVKEDIQEYVPDSSIHHFLDHLCILHGSTLEGRRDAFRILMNKSRFIPIVVNQNPHEIYFPIKSLKDPTNIWICYENIEGFIEHKKTCTIVFKDHTCLECEHPQRIKDNIRAIRRYIKTLDL